MSIEDQNARQRFLQCIMSRKVMTKESITEFLANIGCNQGYQDFLRQVNTDLEFFDLKIQAGNHPITGTTTLCLINCNSDEIAQLATDLTPSELQYFKKLVELIMVDGLYQISSTDALNSNSTITPTISKQIAENAIDKFIADQWLLEKYSCVIRDGFLSFGVRTAVELHLYLKDEFDPFTDCHACKTSYETCENEECDVRIHTYCATKKFENMESPKCPKCQSDWIKNRKSQSQTPKASAKRSRPASTSSSRSTIPATPVETPVARPQVIKQTPSSSIAQTPFKSQDTTGSSTPTAAKRSSKTPKASAKPSKRSRVIESDDSDE